MPSSDPIPKLLLRSARSWRGKPTLPAHETLQDAADYLSEAWADIGAWTSSARQLAFEYLTGLIFNADYSDPATFRQMVESWLTPPWWRIKVRYTGSESLYLGVRTVEVAVENRRRVCTLDPHAAGGTLRVLTVGGRENMSAAVAAYRPRMEAEGPADVILTYTLTYRTNRAKAPGAINWRTADGTWIVALPKATRWRWGVDGEPVQLPPRIESGGAEYVRVPGAVSTKRGSWAFAPELARAMREYVRRERQRERPAYPLEATAAAGNGYILARWAAGAFGSPVPQDVQHEEEE